MMDRDLPIAKLTGIDSVSLVLQYGYYSNLNSADFYVELRAPNAEFAVDQDFSTSTYRLSDPIGLANLLNEKSNEVFEINALHFNMTISRMEHGIRTGYLVQSEFTTILPLSDTPWPPKDGLKEYMLMDAGSIGHLKFAFRCEQTELRDFQQQLATMYRSTMAMLGR